MELCTNLKNRVIDLEKTKTSQAQEITSLKRMVKRLEKKGGSRTHGLKRLYKVGLSARIESSEDEGLGEEDASKQGRIDDIDANEDIYLVNVHRDEDMFGVNDLEGDEVIVETEVDHEVVVETEVASKDVNLSVDEVTLAQALAALKSAKPKADKVMLQEPEQGTITTTTAATTVTAASTRPKTKGFVKVQDKGKGIMVEEPLKMKKKDQVSFDEQEAIRLQAEFDEEERLAREKDEANVALTKEWNDIQAKIDAHYLLAQRLQAKEQEELTDEEKERLVDTFIDYKTELMEESSKKAKVMEESSKKAEAEIAQESSSKRAGEALEQESSKKQKVEEDKESKELKQYLQRREEKLFLNYQSRCMVITRFKKTEPVNYMDNFLLLNLKTMFEHHVEDSVWKNQQGLVKVLNWKLYDSCGVHCVTMQSILYYLLVEKMYPLTNHTLHQMFNDVKLQVDYEF
ncbi:hypothetical protein Tco_0527405 [Tanacetum coccineum]